MNRKLTREQVQKIFDDSPFISFCGMICEEARPEEEVVVIRMPMRPELERMRGTAQYHGGPIASLIDVAGDFALAMCLGGAVPTINFRTDYLRPAFGKSLVATARVRRAGRTVGVVDVDVHDEEDRLVAVGRGCYSTRIG